MEGWTVTPISLLLLSMSKRMIIFSNVSSNKARDSAYFTHCFNPVPNMLPCFKCLVIRCQRLILSLGAEQRNFYKETDPQDKEKLYSFLSFNFIHIQGLAHIKV